MYGTVLKWVSKMIESPEITVISLNRAVGRRASIERQFSELNLPFSFFDAVDGKQGHELFVRYDAEKARRIGEFPLTPGHFGCYASHFLVCAAWKFLRYGEWWAEPVDIEMDQFWANGVECYGVLEPASRISRIFSRP